jgi:hypothetical protein
MKVRARAPAVRILAVGSWGIGLTGSVVILIGL